MKKLTLRFKQKLIRVAKYRTQSKKKRGACKKKELPSKYIRPAEIIKAPKLLCLTGGHARQTVKFLKAIANRVLIQKEPVKINFKETETLYVPGAIYLFAELNRIIKLSNLAKPISIIDPFRRRPREVLKQIEIHKLTGDNCDIVPQREDVVFWKATKGNKQSGDDIGPLIEYVADRANAKHVKQVQVSGIWRGVSEAVANVVDHAYELPRQDGFQGLDETKWWMFTQIRDKKFTAAVCDLGCGYEKTINKNIPESFISGFKEHILRLNKDSVAINIAMTYGRSGTKQGHRGKGSRDALSVLTNHGYGELTILSNSGLVQYSINGAEEVINMEDIGVDIGGTIIWWRLPLTEIEDDQN